MFARTPRLLLRPGFPEDAPALAAAIADRTIVKNLATAPWPFRMRDAEAFLAKPRDPVLPSMLIFERTENAPQLVGSCGLGRRPSGAVEMGYWIARAHWGRGFATEACAALIDIARALGLTRLEGSHFVDNPASGRVLEKLGFDATGLVAPRMSCARGAEAPARLMRLRLTADSPVEQTGAEQLAA
ncbi:MAG TPA: GNAT family N-acetyltransferase [Sphingomicrobium sp.]